MTETSNVKDEEREQPDGWRTSDYVLVSYLAINECYHHAMSHVGTNIYWYFRNNDELQSMIADYQTRESRVEPIGFAAAMRQTMRELDAYKRASQ